MGRLLLLRQTVQTAREALFRPSKIDKSIRSH
jgi:hypothetical protein